MKQTVEMFTIKCDNCGKLFEDEYNGYSCWSDVNDAWENASEVNWIEADFDTHYCPDCYSYDDNDNLIVKKLPPSEEKKEIKPAVEGDTEDSNFIVCDCDNPRINDSNICGRCGGYNRNGF